MKHSQKKLKAKNSKLKAPLAALLAGLASASPASVPLRWTVETSRVSPAVWEAYHGETLALEASLQSYGRPLAATNQEVCIYWQTNGMGAAYWSAPAWASNSVLRAEFTPAMDPGAPVVNGFVGSAGDIYRASFQLRFRPSPGAVPNVLPLPVPTLDFATVAVLNPPYYTQEETDAKIVELDAAIATLSDSISPLSNSIADAASASTNYTDSSESYLRALVSRKADKYKYEEGATSNVLVSCDWWHTGVSILLVEEEDGEDVYWSGTKSRPSPRPSLGGTVYTLMHEIGVGWIFESSHVTSAGHTFVTNQQDRAAAVLDFGDFTLVRTNEVWAAGTNRCPVVYSDDLAALSDGVPGIITHTVTKSYVESLGIESGIQEETDPVWEAEKSGYATTEDLASASDAADAALAYAQGSYLYMLGNTNAWFEGTNYVVDASNDTAKVKFSIEDGMDLLSMPCSMSLWENRDGARRAVWDQRDWTAWYWSFKAAQWTNAVAAAMHTLETNTMRRGWSKYTAVNGLDNPDPSTLHVDTPNITLSPGAEWQKTVEVRGTGYWTIQGNGLTIGPEITTNGAFLTIKDFEGNAALTIRKTASQLVWATREDFSPGSYRDNQDRVVFTLATDTCPIAEFSTTLYDADFVEETDPDVPADFEWTGSSGAWQCHFILKSGINSQTCFARFKILQEGEDVVEHHIPLKISGGISFEQGGTSYKIKPVVNGSTVTWQLVN